MFQLILLLKEAHGLNKTCHTLCNISRCALHGSKYNDELLTQEVGKEILHFTNSAFEILKAAVPSDDFLLHLTLFRYFSIQSAHTKYFVNIICWKTETCTYTKLIIVNWTLQ